MGIPDQQERHAGAEAFSAYLAWLRLSAERRPAFSELCAKHPHLQQELSDLHALAECARSLSDSATVSDALGQSAEIRLSIADAEMTRSGGDDLPQGIDFLGAADLPVRGVDHYEIEGEVARGGMGVIYKVRDRQLHRTLAMKVMLEASSPGSGSGSRGLVARFLEEVQVTAQLDHPGVVAVHRLGVDAAGRPYFTMKLVKGQTLNHIFDLARTEEDGWNLPRALAALVKACQAVAFAHSKGVVHRDLKPANVMVGRFGEVYVMDWGLAKVTGRKDLHDLHFAPGPPPSLSHIQTPRAANGSGTDSPLITMDGSVLGTPAFMPPEQARGQIEDVDALSDIYSLGAILYVLLTGETPYVEPGLRLSPHTVLARVLEGPPKPVQSLNPKAAPQLIAICDKAMARAKKDRYESSLQLAEDLQAFLDGRVVKAYRTGAVAEFGSWVRRNRALATTAAAAVLLLFCSGIAFLINQKLANDRLRLNSYVAEVNVAGRAVANDNLRLAREVLGRHLPRPGEKDLRGFEWRYLWKQCQGNEQFTFDADARTASAVAFSPDGKLLATGGYERSVKIWDFATRQLKTNLTGFPGVIARGGLVFSPDAKYLLVLAEGAALVVDTGNWQWSGSFPEISSRPAFLSAKPLLACPTPDGVSLMDTDTWLPRGTLPVKNVLALNAAPDGRKLIVMTARVAGSTNQEIQVWDALTQTRQAVFAAPMSKDVWFTERPCGFAVSPDGQLLAIGMPKGDIQFWDLRDGRQVASWKAHESWTQPMVFSSDGKTLITGGIEQQIYFWDVATRRKLGSLKGHVHQIWDLALAPDSSALVSASRDGKVKVWRLEPKSQITTLEGTHSLAWISRDSRSLATLNTNSVLQFWDAPRLQPLRTIALPQAGEATAGALTSDGRILALGLRDGGIQLWNLALTNLMTVLRGSSSPAGAFVFAPDDRVLASLNVERYQGAVQGTARLWDVSSGQALPVPPEFAHVVSDINYSRDGRMFGVGFADGTAAVWDHTVKQRLLKVGGHNWVVSSIDFSPDGTMFATSSWDGDIRLWAIPSGQPMGVFKSEASAIFATRFSPDGRTLAGVGSSILLWNVATRQEVLSLKMDGEYIRPILFSPDGTLLVGGTFLTVPAPLQAVQLWQAPSLGNLAPTSSQGF